MTPLAIEFGESHMMKQYWLYGRFLYTRLNRTFHVQPNDYLIAPLIEWHQMYYYKLKNFNNHQNLLLLTIFKTEIVMNAIIPIYHNISLVSPKNRSSILI